VIVLAQDTARDMGHQQIKPEHLLVALAEGEGIAANAMAESGVDRAALRDKVAQRFDSKPSSKKLNKVPFSPEAKTVMEQSLRAALALGHNYIGTEHLFFGVEREAEGRSEALDELLGVNAADVHDRALQILTGATSAASLRSRSPALHAAMVTAARQAGGAKITTGHLLAAMIADTDSQAAKALGAVGITAEAVTTTLAQVPLAETSDATLDAQNASITVDEATTLITDPEVIAALRKLNAPELREVIKKAVGPHVPDQSAS
jgi:ATP-dependent Clp protease ATP-binding subunit ClpA